MYACIYTYIYRCNAYMVSITKEFLEVAIDVAIWSKLSSNPRILNSEALTLYLRTYIYTYIYIYIYNMYNKCYI